MNVNVQMTLHYSIEHLAILGRCKILLGEGGDLFICLIDKLTVQLFVMFVM